jgi:hypothetical protein
VLLADSLIERNGALSGILGGALIALVTAVGTWYFSRRNKTSKTFDYRVGANLPIIFHRPDNDALKVTYLDEEVRNPRIVLVHFVNTGKQVIKADEFLNPYVITLVGSRLLDANVTGQSAHNLVEVTPDGHDAQAGKVQLSIATLNAGDGFSVQMVVDTDVAVQLAVRGRIEGETRATQIYPTKAELSETRTWFTLIAPFGVLLAVVGLLVMRYPSPNAKPGNFWWALGFVIAGVLALGFGVATWIVARRKLRARLRPSGVAPL